MQGLQVVEVRALEQNGLQVRPGTYNRGGRTWLPGWQQAVVDEALLALISNDPWLQVRVLDERLQAKKKMEFAEAAKAKADAAEADAKALRKEANDLLAAAQAALDAVKSSDPLPPAPPAPTPYQDAQLAAMPESAKPKAKK